MNEGNSTYTAAGTSSTVQGTFGDQRGVNNFDPASRGVGALDLAHNENGFNFVGEDSLGAIVRGFVQTTDANLAENELERAGHQIEAHFILSRERTLDQAILLGQIETLHGLNYIDEYLQHVGKVTSDDIARVCAEYLNEDNRTVATLISDGTSVSEDADESLEDDGEGA